jgi:alpha-mannosidase
MPDDHCDEGKHEFSFAVYPHVGTFSESDVAQAAYAFNSPLNLRLGSTFAAAAAKPSLFSVQGARNVVLETIKRGEDDVHASGKGKTLILRLFEQYGGHAKAKLKM